ncbi:Uma2 family endonuclease [Haloactinospora alba]|uniref:Uma2 family endonuclease n=1 Tax=Haloactinospora alba TaxID=405555 RepID=A0A543NNS5_9ACTN|nr:Uma2 family endonuclease [Haloactinospora alba]TQN33498.1 Uma2 family endonuclease [Haloactinospora alba]
MSIPSKEPTVSSSSPAQPLPDWFLPPPGGWTADDLDRLPPEAPRHLELIDGALIVMSPHRSFRARVMMRMGYELDQQAPDGVGVEIEMSVKLGQRQRPEPDIVAFREPQEPDLDRTYHSPADVLLVVEIVSEESAERDRKTKPLKYAEAGIRHFWRVEEESGSPVVYVYERDDVTGSYAPVTVARERLAVSAPFAVDLNVRGLLPRSG